MNKIIEQDLETIAKNLESFRNKIQGKTFLITGGAGFLGSWFCDVLNKFNANIICVDNLRSGDALNVKHLLGSKNFEFIQKSFFDYVPNKQVDYIVHMASIASPPVYQKYPIETLDANILGTKRLLEFAVKMKVKAMLFTSTSEVYGNPPDDMIPTEEDYYGYVSSYGPRSMYDEGKRAAESYCYSFFKIKNTNVRISRIFNSFGPRLDIKGTSQYGRAIIKFIFQAIKNEPISIHGDGKQTRSFCYITDTIEGLFRLLLTDGIDGEVMNIGNQHEISVHELANKIIEATKSKSQIIFDSPPNYNLKDDPRRRCPDTKKAERMIGFKARVNLEEGLERIIEWTRGVGV